MKIMIIESLFARFVLDVCGSIGATWGVLEVFMIRKEENNETCRYIAVVVGYIFFMLKVIIILQQRTCR